MKELREALEKLGCQVLSWKTIQEGRVIGEMTYPKKLERKVPKVCESFGVLRGWGGGFLEVKVQGEWVQATAALARTPKGQVLNPEILDSESRWHETMEYRLVGLKSNIRK